MELIENYISFNESAGTLLVRTEIEHSRDESPRLVTILNRLSKNLNRVKSCIETLQYDDITIQNFLDARNGEYSSVNEFRIDAEGIEEDQDGFEEKTSDNVCYICINTSKDNIRIQTQLEWPIFYDRNHYSRLIVVS